MKSTSRFTCVRVIIFLLVGLSATAVQAQVTTAFTYQGELEHAGSPANGDFDFEFELFDAQSDGVSLVAAVSIDDLTVEQGLFNAEVDFGMGVFGLMDVWLEVRVREGSSTGGYTTLTPRQKVTPAPMAQHALNVEMDAIGSLQIVNGSVSSADINSSQVQIRVIGGCPPEESIRQINANGSVICEPDSVGAPGWALGGNAGTDSSSDFLGTTDNTALELRTANVRSFRIEPSAETYEGDPITTNSIVGSFSNEILTGVRGAAISGGGIPDDASDPSVFNEGPNRITDHYSTIGGGYDNTAGDDAGTVADSVAATIGGGYSNRASGPRSTVGGGSSNTASGIASSIAGGGSNDATGDESFIGGGAHNEATGSLSTIGGGFRNEAIGSTSTVSGGSFNCAGGDWSWAGGQRARVRLKSGAASGAGLACEDVPETGDVDGDEGTFIWADSEDADFTSSGPNQFMVRASGGVAFGRQPDDYFEIQTPFDQATGDGTGTQGAFRIRLNGATRLRLLANGGLAVGNSFNTSGVPERGLRVQGVTRIGDLTTSANNDVCANADGVLGLCSSSQRFKHEVKELTSAKHLVDNLRPVTYRWMDSGEQDIGLVAEEVAAIEPRLVIYNAEGEIQGVKYRQLAAVLVQAMQEQQSELQQLRQQIRNLEHEQRSRLAHMQQQLQRFEAVLLDGPKDKTIKTAHSVQAAR